MRIFYATLLLLSSLSATAQGVLRGTVTDGRGRPVEAASVSLEGTLDGTLTDTAGAFALSTTESGAKTLVVTAIGYASGGRPVTIGVDTIGLLVRLEATAQNLETVTITAGSIEAGAGEKTILKPLDIVTTAGANADVVRAFQTLPGTQQQGTQPGLFVRGGDAGEASIVVDGLTVQNAFFTGPPGVATRSRFQPFQFKGYAFSTGGYSVRYGQALSSVLELNTLDLPEKSTLNLGLNMAGVYASGSKLWGEKSGGEATVYYNNLQPFYGVANTNFDFYDVPKGGGTSAKYAWKPNAAGMLKVFGNFSYFSSGIQVDDPAVPGETLRFGIRNYNGYGSVSYRYTPGEKWSAFIGSLYSYNKDENSWGGIPAGGEDNRVQLRAEARRFFGARTNLLVGTELNRFSLSRIFSASEDGFTETSAAAYAELKWAPTAWLSILPGMRYEVSRLLGTHTLAPRMSAAVRAGAGSTVSAAAGAFYQNADAAYLFRGYRPGQQLAMHYIVNYLWQKEGRTLRLEAYDKEYRYLVRERLAAGDVYNPNAFRYITAGAVDNSGQGYARGAELFWRDRDLIKGLDYWVSYSYIDTRRLYRNFPAEATPDFIADHNLSLVAKYFSTKLQTGVNATYSYATGRPYYNPQAAEFLADRTPDYHNLSVTVNHLRSFGRWFAVIYAGVDNVTNQKNIFGYRYSVDGQRRFPQYPALFRSYFIGANFSLSEFNPDEL